MLTECAHAISPQQLPADCRFDTRKERISAVLLQLYHIYQNLVLKILAVPIIYDKFICHNQSMKTEKRTKFLAVERSLNRSLFVRATTHGAQSNNLI